MKGAHAKWLQYAGIGAGISLAGGLILDIPLAQIAVTMALTAGLVFSGFAMQSVGRQREKAIRQ
ncbi:hypothetical protein [Nitrososphaera viennensis]|uniref:hypothetical protein n=1 Tax=Nitrososphaera viennensis TaxID=1034015 RepID=UPI0009467EB1|nr:hypothetical protein [Nitrososphaera viennensis]